ncbi:PD-(D/E)XK nuclease family protein [Planctomycetota bacterium]|nr:PD-(D/E)XK nuclease family protein [Planctomycetota bacterium]
MTAEIVASIETVSAAAVASSAGGHVSTESEVVAALSDLGRTVEREKKRIRAQLTTRHEVVERATAFSALGTLGLERAEIRHTAALAWALDPEAAHQVGRAVCSRLLGRLGHDLPAVYLVHKEAVLAEGRIDIQLVAPDGRPLVGIENKVDDKDRDDQLAMYERDLRLRNDGVVLIYLSPHGSAPTAPDCERWQLLSYSAIAKAILSEVGDGPLLTEAEGELARQWLQLYAFSVVHMLMRAGEAGCDLDDLSLKSLRAVESVFCGR